MARKPMSEREKVARRIECLSCGDICQSKHVHHLSICKCGKVGVDGGDQYTRLKGEFGSFRFVEPVEQECTACGLVYVGINFGWCGCNTAQENPLIK